jgi:DNA-binding CsgD family transcriptional regulator
VLVLDVKQRRADPELIPGLMKRFADLRILVFVNHTAEECGMRHLLLDGGRAKLAPEALAMVDDCCLTSLRQKALGCLAMGTQPAGVLEAVRAVARGEVAAAPWLTAVASSLAAAGDADGIPPITPRELQVLALLAKGHSNKQIARILEIREQTVKNHVGRLMEKLGVGSRLEAGLFAAEHHVNLVDAP